MPTPVNTARQCLTEEAARALDEAVSVARRRSHAQTTSLHAISALLSLPTNALRDACARAGTTPYSPRLQFRALELSVGVSLDRLPTSKSAVFAADGGGPPVSNSLMAAIKRSQANQRRHPESFHLLQIMQQQNQQNQTASFLKVELKHFILSILDDPIVSRVFAEAGFRSYDIKFALIQPPPVSRFFHRSMPPVFLCNIEPEFDRMDRFRFDENSRRIVEVIAQKGQSQSKKNPLLMGVYAKTALKRFIELVQSGKVGFLPDGLDGLSVVSIENEIFEFVVEGGSEEKMGLRFDEVGRLIEQCLGVGVVVSVGEIEVLVKMNNDDDYVAGDAVVLIVSRLTRLLEVYGKKVWLIGVAGTCDVYSKFLRLFPMVDKDWDLHLLTVTSATPSMEGLYPKSSLMGSFVPFGGFFSTPTDYRNPVTCTNASSLSFCDTCNEKYEQEVADNVKVVGPSTSASTSLPWLQKVNVDSDRGLGLAKTNEDDTSLNTKIFGLQRKWSDICRHIHQNKPFHCSSPIPYMSEELQTPFPSKQILPVSVTFDSNVRDKSELVPKVSKFDIQNTPVTPSVTTDLVLGTTYASVTHEPDTPKLSDHKKNLQHLSDSLSTDFDAMNESTLEQHARSSSYSGPNANGKFEMVDFKSLYKRLTEKVWWQDEAIYAIIRIMSLCRFGAGKHGQSNSNVRGDTWFSFLGPDKVGKGKIASALAETLFGSKQSLISVDLSSQDRIQPLNSVFECHDVLRRKTVVDYIAGELSKNPCSVVFLENIGKADLLVQNSLFQVIRTGKFPYSNGREISINNAVFIVTSSVFKVSSFSEMEKEPIMFPEERILEAKRCQIELSLGRASEDVMRNSSTNVRVAKRKGTFFNKRKLVESSDYNDKVTCKTLKRVKEASQSYFDLNMPVEEEVEEESDYDDCENESLIQNHEPWLNDFLDQIDGKVGFKPFNFDLLAEQAIECINKQFKTRFGSNYVLEIDYEVMSQILAASWLSDKKKTVEDWIEHVVGSSFDEAQRKYQNLDECVMRLIKCESIFVEEYTSGVCLPARINLN